VAFDRSLSTQNWGTFVMPTTCLMICRNAQSSRLCHRLFLSEADLRCCGRDVIQSCTLLCLPPLRVRRRPSEKLAFASGFELHVPQPTITRVAACRVSRRLSLFSMTRPNLGQRHDVLTLACAPRRSGNRSAHRLVVFAPSRCDHTHHPSPFTV
jgi:hypothetical protein